MKKVIVVPYDEIWKTEFEKIKEELSSVLNGHIISIEHVGSTSVEGLAAKPIIDNYGRRIWQFRNCHILLP